jgi:hypothetical protein
MVVTPRTDALEEAAFLLELLYAGDSPLPIRGGWAQSCSVAKM